MRFTELAVAGAYVVDIDKYSDDRGFFARTWCKKEFQMRGLRVESVQSNLALSNKKGTLRGLHYQISPFEEAKLVRCTRGAICDVIVDLRCGSGTYKKWVSIELISEEYTMLYVPEGCAHGYQTLADDTEVAYQVSQYYSPDHERGLRWNDPEFNIKWPIVGGMVISDKDASWPNYQGA